MTEPTSSPDIMPATVRGRWLSAALVALAAALVTFFYWVAMPALSAAMSPAPAPGATMRIKLILLGLAILATGSAIALILSGKKMLDAKQSPPPGAWLWRDTKVLRGAAAKRLGWACIASGIAASVICIALVGYMWLAFDRHSLQNPAPSGAVNLNNGAINK